ncbi:MAG: secondary thiamine-phosphate synthase enzyme YjbQ [Candidatus Kapabacteria bacterium]|nr:secondary thiamine-phosphate synthase enzyme YjbQ [Candidatus Kapabacteria bacterium]MCS7169620.1 secondary thiamine-phosphate synthase enzyme YjbQ [Candidatus Kapabacteria bacterium]MDW7997061.1 secondary thiamine-phosphate synthase enzyme YjbQ [Bacteroidota bacterium]MDW8226116.1 secondary thiamine-phosphate synthase enzyme YjbQ [Bacteroidota bacterium]
MVWYQRQLRLSPKGRGIHLVTEEILQQLPELRGLRRGVLHLFLQHTSASLAINENADPTVRSDLERFLRRLVPEDTHLYEHTVEGPDDMTSHIKSVLIGCSLIIPVVEGQLGLGTWQGIYLCEHRERARARSLIATLWGEKA